MAEAVVSGVVTRIGDLLVKEKKEKKNITKDCYATPRKPKREKKKEKKKCNIQEKKKKKKERKKNKKEKE